MLQICTTISAAQRHVFFGGSIAAARRVFKRREYATAPRLRQARQRLDKASRPARRVRSGVLQASACAAAGTLVRHSGALRAVVRASGGACPHCHPQSRCGARTCARATR